MHYTDLHEKANRDEAFHSTLESVIPVFQKPFQERTKKENKLVISLLQQIPYFNKYCYIYNHYAEEDKYLSQAMKEAKKKEALKNLSTYFKYEYFPAGSAIRHQGDITDKFFLILKGQVRRYVDRPFVDIQKELKARAEPSRGEDIHEKKVNTRPSHGSESTVGDSRSTVCPESISSFRMTPNIKIVPNVPSLEDLIPEDEEEDIEDQNVQERTSQKASPEEIRIFKSFNMEKKYFLSGLLAMKFSKKFLEGDYIGEMSLSTSGTHSDTLIAWVDTHLITIERKYFEKAFDVLLRQNREKLDFVSGMLPNIPKNEITTFAYGFEQMYHRTPTILFQSGDKIDGLYIVKEGEVELFTTIRSETMVNKPNSLFKTKPSSRKISVVVIPKGQFLGEEVLLGAEERTFTAVTRVSNTVVYFIPRRHLEKMAFYHLSVIEYLKSLADTLNKAKTKLLQKALKQDKYCKTFMSRAVENIIQEEKENLGELIAEIAEKKLEEQREALKESGLIRLQPSKSEAVLAKKDREQVRNFIEIKEQVKFIKAKIDPALTRKARAQERSRIVEEDAGQSMVKFLKNPPDRVVSSEKGTVVYPLSLWENARKKFLPKKRKQILESHLAELSKLESEKGSFTYDIGSLAHKKSKLHPNIFDTERTAANSSNFEMYLHLNENRAQHGEISVIGPYGLDCRTGAMDMTAKTLRQHLLPRLNRVLNTKLDNNQNPIYIQSVTDRSQSKHYHHPKSLEKVSYIDSETTQIENLFENKNRNKSISVANMSVVKPFRLPELRPPKALISKAGTKMMRPHRSKRLSELNQPRVLA